MTTPEPTITEYRDWHGYPWIQIKIGDSEVAIHKGGISLGGEEFYWSNTADIDDLIACLREAQRMLADLPPHLLSPRHIPRPQSRFGACRSCGGTLDWVGTSYPDDGQWVHAELAGDEINGWAWVPLARDHEPDISSPANPEMLAWTVSDKAKRRS